MKAVILTIQRKIAVVTLSYVDDNYEAVIESDFILLNVVHNGRKYLPNNATAFEIFNQFETISLDLITSTHFREKGKLVVNPNELNELNIFKNNLSEANTGKINADNFDGCEGVPAGLVYDVDIYWTGELIVNETQIYTDANLTIPLSNVGQRHLENLNKFITTDENGLYITFSCR